ncbi:MAG: aminotransferase class IV, partial [Armatimonadota bacterium]
ILRATLPAGSITGAPKIRAMQIIDELESSSRGVYCGCIGAFMPGNDMLLNVAIRTIVQQGDQCEMGIGSGIVADSDPHNELQETILKGSFLKMVPVDFELLETLLYSKTCGYAFLNEHLTRMHHSAVFFGWNFYYEGIQEALVRMAEDHIAVELHADNARVRLRVSIRGGIIIEWMPIESAASQPVRLLLASRRTDPNDVFLYHKTTHRKAYDHDFYKAREAGFYDVLYMNSRDELTECAITNVMIKIDGRWYTPPVSSGLLPGIWRDSILSQDKAAERILTQTDLINADQIMICNSVREEIEVGTVEAVCESGGTEIIWSDMSAL